MIPVTILTRPEWDSMDIDCGYKCPDCGQMMTMTIPYSCDCPKNQKHPFEKIHINGNHHRCKKPN